MNVEYYTFRCNLAPFWQFLLWILLLTLSLLKILSPHAQRAEWLSLLGNYLCRGVPLFMKGGPFLIAVFGQGTIFFFNGRPFSIAVFGQGTIFLMGDQIFHDSINSLYPSVELYSTWQIATIGTSTPPNTGSLCSPDI